MKVDLGQTLNTLANLGVVAGIVFLAVELRQNNDVLRMQADSENRQRVTGVIELVINNPEYTELMAKPETDLSDYERNRLVALGIRELQNYEALYRDVTDGRVTLNDAIKRIRGVWHRGYMNYGAPLAWELYKMRSDADFIQWMERYIIDEDGAER